MSIAIVLLSQCPPEPWRNGGGTTRTLLTWPLGLPPPAAAFGAGARSVALPTPSWWLRVSVADITQDGPFSAYEGIDRGFAVLEGEGVVLDLPDGSRRLRPAYAPVAFAGESAAACRLLGGPTRDLNLMVKRGAGRLHLQRAQAEQTVPGQLRWRAVYAHRDAVLQLGPERAEAFTLPAGALCWEGQPPADPTRSAPALPWRVVHAPQAYVLSLEAE